MPVFDSLILSYVLGVYDIVGSSSSVADAGRCFEKYIFFSVLK